MLRPLAPAWIVFALLLPPAGAGAETITLADGVVMPSVPADAARGPRFRFDATGAGPETSARASVIVVRGGAQPPEPGAADPVTDLLRLISGLCRPDPGFDTAAVMLPSESF